MYRHILVPTDGSDLSAKAVAEAVRLARCTGAKLTALHVLPRYLPPYYAEAAMMAPGAIESVYSLETFEKETAAAGQKALDAAHVSGRVAGIDVAMLSERSDSPAESILATAAKVDCDVIVMASHGRRGLQALLLGSETTKVLTHSKLPVLVVR
jgi:nucleotide-binding universal stress UspA family protein